MKEFFQSWKVRTVIGLVLFIIVFSAGAFARPGIDLAFEILRSFGGKPEVYVARLSDNERAIEEALKTPKNVATCRAIAEMDVINDTLQRANARYDEIAPIINRKTTMIENGISEKTAMATNSIEKAQGR